MSTISLIAVIVVAAVVVIALIALLWALSRRRHLRERFGPEYERTVEERGDRRAAERDLRAREERHGGSASRSCRPRAGRSTRTSGPLSSGGSWTGPNAPWPRPTSS